MENYSYIFLQIFFALITFITVAIFIKACSINKKSALIIISIWLTIQGILSYSEFYFDTFSLPPRFVLLLGPTLIAILILFFTKKGKAFINQLNPVTLTYLHAVRVPVEFGLLWLCQLKLVPELMTFKGDNFDIISGITAPFIAYFGIVKNKIPKAIIVIWNFICMILLFLIVIHAILSVPTPFQQLAFDQPNIGILMFPFSWLACCIVPIVLLSHLVCIKVLLSKSPR